MARAKKEPPSVEDQRIALENAALAFMQKLDGLATEEERTAAIEKVKAEDPLAIEVIKRVLKAVAARIGDNPRTFSQFYELIQGNKLPAHCAKWIEELYRSHEEGVGNLLDAFRGSWKSTTVSVAFNAYRLGKEPHGTSLQVNANDDSADKITASIANIIENNPGWKMTFPHVVPDYKRGWGAEGYWLRDLTYKTDEDWAQKLGGRIDPTLVGGGIGSSKLIGKHPTVMLNFDDIHDEKNSSSPRQRSEIVTIVLETLLPTAVKDKDGKWKTWVNNIATPWDEEDVTHCMDATGQYNHLTMPVMTQAEEGEDGAVYIDGRNRNGVIFNDIAGWWKLTWPDMFSPQAIIADRARYGRRGFWRMMMMDLKSAKVGGLVYHLYPHQMIDRTHWQMGAGCDFAEVLKESRTIDPGRDFFSMAIGAKSPLSKIVVCDGVLEQCTQAQAEVHLSGPQNLYRHWKYTKIEGNGKGETFFVVLKLRNPSMKVVMDKLRTIRRKEDRLSLEMGPWLENGAVMVSDEDTPYLNALRKAMDDFPNGNMDILDGMYWLCKVFPECLIVPNTEEALPAAVAVERRAPNPFNAFGRK